MSHSGEAKEGTALSFAVNPSQCSFVRMDNIWSCELILPPPRAALILESRMRFRSFILLLWPVLFLVPYAAAQKRVVATVNPNAAALNSNADIFNPATRTLTPVTGMLTGREQNVAVRLASGRVLIAGGYNNRHLVSAELYDPETGTFEETDDMVSARSGAAAALLQGGTVLLAGGYNGQQYLSSAEIYDPATETFGPAGASLLTARQNATATRLNNGTILIVGGYDGSAFLNSSEIYNSAVREFSYTDGFLADAREWHTATLLSDGRVLITGGCNNVESGKVVCDEYLSSAEIYDPDSDAFISTGSMTAPRANHTATLLPNGKVLIAGGWNGTNTLASAEVFDPETETFTSVGNLAFARINHTASLLSDGKVLIAGGKADQHLDSLELFDPAANSFTLLPAAMTMPRSMHSAIALADGRIMLVGGENSELLYFDVNSQSIADNVSPNIIASSDSKTAFVPYTGSGVVAAFSTETGAVIKKIITGGKPAFMTELPDGETLAVVSVLDNRIFTIDMKDMLLKNTYSFNGSFGFGSLLTLSPDGGTGYISSTSTGSVIKFDMETGNELGRLTNMQAPAQITITKDGNTLLIVDTMANNVVIADASAMTVKARVLPLEDYSAASFTIFNKAVLNADETMAVIGSQDSNSSSDCVVNAAFVFDPATGEILETAAIGCIPGYTTFLPTGTYWLILGQGNISQIPSWAPESSFVNKYTLGTPMGSANVIITKDAKYAYYALSSADVVVQQDIGTRAIVGSFSVGDDPDKVLDQASSLAVTPDEKTMIVLNFSSNELDLLGDAAVFRNTKYISQQNQFTGLSMVNVSDTPATLTITAFLNSGILAAANDIVNPVSLEVGPNSQASVDLSSLYDFDPDDTNEGRLFIQSDNPGVTGFSMTGKVRADFLQSRVVDMFAFPLQTDYRESLRNWIIPEIPQSDDAKIELNFFNPNYNSSPYTVTHYGTDGTELETKRDLTVNASVRETKALSDLLTTAQAGRVLIVGGNDLKSTWDSASTFSVSAKTFTSTTRLLNFARHGHAVSQLSNQKVLITGGKRGTAVTKSAELYYPIEGFFRPTAGTMRTQRYRHTSTRLAGGKVLLAGGQSSRSFNKTAELYDPNEDAFEPTAGDMTSARDAHTATLLPDGRVLIVGGIDGISVSATAELYQPETSLFTLTGRMTAGRAFHTAVLLPSGKVLIAGGYNGSYLDSAELYDPETGLFTSAGSMTGARSNHTATLLSNGTVLIAGGRDSEGSLNTAEIYDPLAGTFLPTEGTMVSTRRMHTATLLDDDTDGIDDKVLITGGFGMILDDDEEDDDDPDQDGLDEEHVLKTAELYDPVTRQFSRTTGDLSQAVQVQAAILLQSNDQGYLRVQSDLGLLFSEIYSIGGASASINGIDIDKHTGVTRIYSPLFVIKPDFATAVNIINANQDSEAFITIRLHAEDGSLLSSPVVWLISPNGQLKGDLWDIFHNDTSLLNRTGWIEVTSTVDKVVGTVTFTDPDDTIRTSIQLSGFPMSRFLFPLVSEDATYQTEISLLNTGDQTASVLLELWGTAGTLDAFANVSLPPNRRLTGFLGDIFPDIQPHLTGNVRIISDRPLHGFAILSARDLTFITAEPPVPYPGQ
ncbi:MAG: hypothetical protein JXA73_21300 [Acidobacteria bacterium]|nr:hypothetical protein [Acidobacteriota bacterium]